MKKGGLLLFLMLTWLIESVAQVYVDGYYRKDGTYVQPHYRSNPDGNPYNNWSFPGNTNPYTGKVATGNPDTYLDNYYNRDRKTSNSNIATYEYPNSSNSLEEYYNSLLRNQNYKNVSEEITDEILRAYRYAPRDIDSRSVYREFIETSNAIKYHSRYNYHDKLKLEIALNNLGYYVGNVDGNFDETTIKGIKDFQRRNGLNPDGKLGSASVLKLGYRLK